MMVLVALAVTLASLTAFPAISWAGQVPTVEQVCGKWLGGTAEDAEKWLMCRKAYEGGEISKGAATTPSQLYCPIKSSRLEAGREQSV